MLAPDPAPGTTHHITYAPYVFRAPAVDIHGQPLYLRDGHRLILRCTVPTIRKKTCA